MKNLETIAYYEKLHDIFERVHPQDMPKKLENIIKYLEDCASKHYQLTGDVVPTSDALDILREMHFAFSEALKRENRCMLLVNLERKYEVNIYPIMRFLKENSFIAGEMGILKSSMVHLINPENIGMFKQNFTFIDSISIIFED